MSENDTFTFSLKDRSSLPYAWILEAVDLEAVQSMGSTSHTAAIAYVTAYAKGQINALNHSDKSDDEVYQSWVDETWEFNQAVTYVADQLEAQYQLAHLDDDVSLKDDDGLA